MTAYNQKSGKSGQNCIAWQNIDLLKKPDLCTLPD